MRSSLRAELLVELQIQDSIIAGRSPLEFTYLLIGGAAGWTVFQIPGPIVVRALLALALVAAGTAFAFLRLGDQDLTAWGVAIIRYLSAPRLALYGPRTSQ